MTAILLKIIIFGPENAALTSKLLHFAECFGHMLELKFDF